MGTIRLLSEGTINRIAAGEVVDRPHSVVRELVDNALDAEAKSITVETRAGGRSLIRIVDDGYGIPADQIQLAFERHATSKLSSEEDLTTLHSYGFRGEALAAIASVSRVKIRSRHRDEEVGQECEFDAGKMIASRSVACPVGTEIAVQDLFYNTPARRKFLKSERGEVTLISTWLRSNMLLHPTVRFRYLSDGKEKLHFARRDTVLERCQEVYAHDAVEVSYEEDNLRVDGYLCAPKFAKATPQALTLFVNKRMLTDRALLRAAREGYLGTLKPNQSPLGVLHLTFPPHLVDINVHPQKQEVRFWNSSRAFQVVLRAVRSAVGGFSAPIPARASVEDHAAIESESRQLSVGNGEIVQERSQPSFSYRAPLAREKGVAPISHHVAEGGGGEELSGAEPSNVSSGGAPHATTGFRYRDLRYVGTVLQCYLLCEYEERFIIIDMHAAHERINYNKILSRLSGEAALHGGSGASEKGGGALKREPLLIPLTLEFEEEVVEELLARQALFRRFGFLIHGVAPSRVEIREKPVWIPLKNMKKVLEELVAEELPVDRVLESELEKVAARLACHASVRSGDLLQREEVYALFDALDEAEWSSACPHGRPVLIHFTVDEIEKFFGRQ